LQAIFSPSGNQIVTYFYNGSVLLWDIENFNLLWKVQLPEPAATGPLVPNRPLSQLLLSRDENLMVVSSNIDIPSVFVWNVREKVLIHEITIPSFQASGGIVEIRALSDSLEQIVVLSADGQLVIVDVINALLLDRLKRAGQVGNY
jgi:WD40 repeat protein